MNSDNPNGSSHHLKDKTTQISFNCPSDLFAIAKSKAIAQNKSLDDYLVELILKDFPEKKPKFADKKMFKKALESCLQNDDHLLRKLSKR